MDNHPSAAMTTQAPALTTTFTPAKSCFQYYKYRYTGTELTCLEGGTGAPSACTYMQLGPSGSDANCFPSSLELGSTFYYSPGICPSGFEVACSSTVGGETRATCCPRYEGQWLPIGRADISAVHLVVKLRRAGLGTALIFAPSRSHARSR